MFNKSSKKTDMAEANPLTRRTNFEEVAQGYTAEQAVEEANRCLNCKHRPCVAGCPVQVAIPEFITEIKNANFGEAGRIIKNTNSLPAVCGRVCPQENQCEKFCVRKNNGEAVGIGRLERFAADYLLNNEAAKSESENAQAAASATKAETTGENAQVQTCSTKAEKADKSVQTGTTTAQAEAAGKNAQVKTSDTQAAALGKKIAIVGAGPAGLTCAGDLAKAGCDVTIYESLHKAGGVLVYGIPEFRLPKSIVAAEVENLLNMGVKIVTNVVVGKTVTVDELFEQGFKAVFISSGAGLPGFMGIDGEQLVGVFSANEYLTRVNLMKAFTATSDTPVIASKSVAVIGGGNVAMDAARCAKRLGAQNVSLVYRRTKAEMPARLEELHHAVEEGIDIIELAAPIELLADEQGRVKTMNCIRMQLGEPDASGRRRPVEMPNSNFEIEADTVIMAIGTSPNPLIHRSTSGLSVNKWGCIEVDDGMRTSRNGVFAGGDAVTGAATVIEAMGAGKIAAKSIVEFLGA